MTTSKHVFAVAR